MTEPGLEVPAPSPTPAAPPSPSRWHRAVVEEVRRETARAKTFRLRLEAPSTHRPGQHAVVRLTAPDGYRAQRSYSIASAPDDSSSIELTVERLEDGEVSSFLHDVVEPGDELEVRTPIGGWFVWEGGGPALLVGGGSGVVPLMAMLRHARRTGTSALVRLVVSVRAPGDLYYAAELPGPETTVVHTRVAPPGDERPPGHLRAEDLGATIPPGATAYVCGTSGFADHATGLLLERGVPASSIRVERFGPSARPA